MPPLAVAAVGAAVGIGGAVLSSRAQTRAANTAANTAEQNTAANNALAREMYGNNSARLDPYAANGMAASNVLNGMLLGTTAPAAVAAGNVQTTPASTMGTAPWTYAQIAAMRNDGIRGNAERAQAELDAFYANRLSSGAPAGGAATNAGYPGFPYAAQPTPAPSQPKTPYPVMDGSTASLLPGRDGVASGTGGVATGGVNPNQSAWDQFRNSTNYQFRLNEGMKALNQGYAARGMLESGAAMRGINDYAQNFASNELGNYMNLLSQQQQMGMGAASALAGVGQNMVNNVTANNNAAASAAANAALMRGQSNANMWGNIAGSIGNVLGSSYGR